MVADFFKPRRWNDCLSLCNTVQTPCIAGSNAVTVPPLPCSPPRYVVTETAFVVRLLHNRSSVGKILNGKSGSSDVIGFISRNHALPGLVCHLQEHVLLTSYCGVIRSRNRRFYFYLQRIFQNITINFRIITLLQCKFVRCRCTPVAFYSCRIQYVTRLLCLCRGDILNQIKISVDKKNQLDVTFCILYFSSNSCSTCFGQPCAHHQELTTA